MEPLFVLHGAATLSLVRLPLVGALHKVSFPPAALMLETSSACSCDIDSSTFLPKGLKTRTVHSSVQHRRDLTRIFTWHYPPKPKA